uniref:Uncharacterized protein n=2 Tax=Helianthus annuus TaxID=4232 RepID=A0A251V1Z4_HELAN
MDSSDSKNNKRRRRSSPNKAAASSSASKRRSSEQHKSGLLCSMDDAFHLTCENTYEPQSLLRSQRLPTAKEYDNWDCYVTAFFFKMASCPLDRPPFSYSSLMEQAELMESPPPSQVRKQFDEDFPITIRRGGEWVDRIEVRRGVRWPFKFGSYPPWREPDRIPYHLFLLVKEADDIMRSRNNPNDVTKLALVEKKIHFFCKYFYCHLPRRWEYNRDDASDVVACYDLTRDPIYNMAGYTPISISSLGGWDPMLEYDEETGLSRHEMITVLCIIHSRKTPTVWKMTRQEVLFYCKVCSCFGIDYHRLEAASEDDVCLMNVGSYNL